MNQEYGHSLKNMVFNYDEIKGSNWISEPGQYEVEIINIETSQSDNGKPRANITFEDKKTTAVHKEYFYLNPESLWRMKILVTACGIFESGRWLQEILNRTLIIELHKVPANKVDDLGKPVYYNKIKQMYRSNIEAAQHVQQPPQNKANDGMNDLVDNLGEDDDPF